MPSFTNLLAAPSSVYPAVQAKAQPWKKWVKFEAVQEDGKVLVCSRNACANAVSLGGY